MKKIFTFLVILIAILTIVYQCNNNPGFIVAGLLKKSGIKQGDLKYRINLLGIIPLGEATFMQEKTAVYNGKRVFHLNATAAILKCYAKFFKGSVVLDSFIDISNYSPFFFGQKIEAPGKENPSKNITYDQKNNTMTLDGVTRSIYPNTQDPLSAVFNLKKMNFDKIKEIEMNINTNQKNYILSGTVKNKDITVENKIYDTVSIDAQIYRRDKEVYHKSKVAMFLLKENGNIPILIKVFAGGVLINARLVDIL